MFTLKRYSLPLWIFALYLMLLCPWSIAGNPIEFARSEYAFFRNTAEFILKKFPKDQYYYVGVGRSPTVLTAYLQLLDPDSAGHLPASKAKWAPPFNQLSQEQRWNLKMHLNRFLPSQKILGKRKILLIDHIQSGWGIKTVREYVNGLIELNQPAETLGLVFSEHDFEYLQESVDHKFIYKDKEQSVRFALQRYDKFSAFSPADLTFGDLIDVMPNPHYVRLLEALERAQKSCSALLCFKKR